MKRMTLAILAVVVLNGGLVWGQSCCPPPTCCPPLPCCPPPAPEPPCYEGFWLGESILIQVVIPQGRLCCCEVTTKITGWRVEAFGGGVVYEHVYPSPVSAGTSIVWNQRASGGGQVGEGFYRIVVGTTDKGDVQTYIKLVDRANCRSLLCSRPSKPCGIPICNPYLKLSPAPVPPCTPCCDPCRDPCCSYPSTGK